MLSVSIWVFIFYVLVLEGKLAELKASLEADIAVVVIGLLLPRFDLGDVFDVTELAHFAQVL